VADAIGVDDILDHLAAAGAVGVSRSTLDRRFAQTLGRSPKQEIARVRIDRIKQLLVETDLTLSDIAIALKLNHTEYLNTLFKREVGETPGVYRSRMGNKPAVAGPARNQGHPE
jgi:LacI family transcriptional regulator